MTIDQLKHDKAAMEAIRSFFTHPKFNDIRIAFTNHSPSGDDKLESSIAVHHGKNLGTRYVFNKLEEMVKTPAEPSQPVRRNTGGNIPDPDLAG